ESDIVDGLLAAHQGIRELIEIQNEFLDGIRQPEMEWTPVTVTDELRSRIEAATGDRIADAMSIAEKAERNAALAALREEVVQELAEEFPEQEQAIGELLSQAEKAAMRRQIVERGIRADGRKPDDIRPITCEVSVLPRTHGSALFTRGQTQALAIGTLGTSADEQRIDSIDVQQETTKSFMLHYNFPPFATGEAKPIRGTSRREQGHGALAER